MFFPDNNYYFVRAFRAAQFRRHSLFHRPPCSHLLIPTKVENGVVCWLCWHDFSIFSITISLSHNQDILTHKALMSYILVALSLSTGYFATTFLPETIFCSRSYVLWVHIILAKFRYLVCYHKSVLCCHLTIAVYLTFAEGMPVYLAAFIRFPLNISRNICSPIILSLFFTISLQVSI